MKNLNDQQYLLGLSDMLNELVGELDSLSIRDENDSMGAWLALHDAHTLTLAASIVGRLSLWAKHQGADQYVDRKEGKAWDRLRLLIDEYAPATVDPDDIDITTGRPVRFNRTGSLKPW